jgi:hypothetical protein
MHPSVDENFDTLEAQMVVEIGPVEIIHRHDAYATWPLLMHRGTKC